MLGGSSPAVWRLCVGGAVHRPCGGCVLGGSSQAVWRLCVGGQFTGRVAVVCQSPGDDKAAVGVTRAGC